MLSDWAAWLWDYADTQRLPYFCMGLCICPGMPYFHVGLCSRPGAALFLRGIMKPSMGFPITLWDYADAQGLPCFCMGL